MHGGPPPRLEGRDYLVGHVGIVGGGLSGLCLAQALLRSGRVRDVTVFERDASAEVRGQGYRLTIDPIGGNARRECLPSHIFDFICDTSKAPIKGGGFLFLDDQAQVLHRLDVEAQMIKTEEGGDNDPKQQRRLAFAQVDRAVLRQALLSG